MSDSKDSGGENQSQGIIMQNSLLFHGGNIECESGSSWYSKPGEYGNAAGETIQNTLGKAGQPVGNALGRGVAPVGNVVDSLVGGVMKAPDALNDAPQWGGNVETKARDTAGKLADQGKEAVEKGKESATGKGEGEAP